MVYLIYASPPLAEIADASPSGPDSSSTSRCSGWRPAWSRWRSSPRSSPFIPSDAAGRAYAAYGGVYIAASILWLWLMEGQRPDRWDLTGLAVCLVGSAIILLPATT